jgi:hypothetical protein
VPWLGLVYLDIPRWPHYREEFSAKTTIPDSFWFIH